MSDIDVPKELAEAQARLPVVLPDREMPLELQIRSIALTIAQRHCGDRTVHEGQLYQQLKMDNKLEGPLTVNHVIHAALVFERYLWGEWSKGIAENAIRTVTTEAADVLEEEWGKRLKRVADNLDEPPTRPSSGADK